MRLLFRRLTAAMACVAALLSFSAQPAAARFAYIHVNTSSDADNGADGLCSVREAIIATNTRNGIGYKDCPAGSTGADTIYFDVSPINVTSELPAITVGVHIDSYLNGARAELRGPGSGTGLHFSSPTGASTVASLVVDNFATGIYDETAPITITASVIGPNSDTGIEVLDAQVKIGGSNPGTPGVCSGDCNRIAGNGAYGIRGNMDGSITGNLIGLDATGAAAQANGVGIYASGGVTIGGVTADLRNVISGNTTVGVRADECACTIEGNYIGTDVTGVAAVPNGRGVHIAGWYCDSYSGCVGYIVGGASGAGNLISGNTGAGLYVEKLNYGSVAGIFGNTIGVNAAGNALGNGGDGVEIASNNLNNAYVGPGNVIAYNGNDGVEVVAPAAHGWVQASSIHDNVAKGIEVDNGANGGVVAPVISGVSPVHGTACASCTVDIYSDAADEGKTYEGVVTADGSGNWTFSGTPIGPHVTATATDVYKNTSEFSAAVSTVALKPDARIRKGSGSFVGNNVYNTSGLNQTRSGSTTAGNTIKFGISIQNDSTASDQFKLAATGTSVSGYTVRYFRGTTEITSAVVAGTYTTPALAAGAALLITAKVNVASSAAVGSSVTRLVTASSVGDASRKDAVKFVAKRT